jgi:hypothetical protein
VPTTIARGALPSREVPVVHGHPRRPRPRRRPAVLRRLLRLRRARGAIHPETVAAYIAKYSTKSATDLDPGVRPANPHLARVRATVLQLAELAYSTYPPGLPEPPNPYLLLGKWAHMLAFRGHFASKSRRYSTTMGRLRSARRRFERAKAFNPDRVVDVATLDQDLGDDQTTLVINDWRFVGTGWITGGDAILAAEASEVVLERVCAKRSARRRDSSGATKIEETWP